MLLSPKVFALIAAAICLFFALSLNDRHIARFFDYKVMTEAQRKATARSWRMTAFGLCLIFAGIGSGRGSLMAFGAVAIGLARAFSPPKPKG